MAYFSDTRSFAAGRPFEGQAAAPAPSRVFGRPYQEHRPVRGWRTRAYGACGVSAVYGLLIAGVLIAGPAYVTRQTDPASVAVTLDEQVHVVELTLPPPPPRVLPPAVDVPDVVRPQIHLQTPPVAQSITLPPPPEREVAPPVQPSPPATAPAIDIRTPYYQRLQAHLYRHLRYPHEARRMRAEGVVFVAFSMDRQGKVLSASVVESSGVEVLDEEAVALVWRSQPLPRIPEELPETVLNLTVPIEFVRR